MEQLLESIREARIFGPGDIYIFFYRKSPEWDPGPIGFMYIIRCEEEILPAIELDLVHIAGYEILEYIGCVKVTDRCFEFKMLCNDPESGQIHYSLFLHRISTLQEARERWCNYQGE